MPIAMSRKITVESIKHLGQHTDLIQDIDKKTGKITPSKILNIHKEETLDTYENRFVNTLIDRLYIFINIRYNKLVQTAEAQEAYSFNYDTVADSGDGRKVNISFKIETVDSLVGGSKDTDVWARLERVKKAIEGYKGSVLCTTLGNAFIRPPVMRTNAITKNVDLMACLTLWQFIESYDKAGYEVNVSDTAQRPDDSYIEDIYGLIAMNYMLFRSYTHGADKSEELKTIKNKTLAPKVVRRFDKQTSDKYDVIVGEGEESSASKTDMGMTAEEAGNLTAELDRIVEIEKQFLKDEEDRKRAEELAAAEAERKRAEQEELERQRREEEERIRLEHEKAERRRLELIQNSRRSRLQEKRRSVRNVNAVKKRKRSSISQDAKGKWKSVSAVKRSSVSVRKELGSERRKSSSAAALDLLWISRSARMKKPCLQALCQSMSPLRSLQKRRKKHNSSVSRNVVNVNVLSVLKLNVKALKIKISMRYLKNIPKIHITWQNVA